MNLKEYFKLLTEQFNNQIGFREKRLGIYQLVAPYFHEDGDMYDIFLMEKGDRFVRITDEGLTLMRLSYSFDIDTPNKQRIFQKILSENYVCDEDGTLYMDVPVEKLYPAIQQFAQTISKVSNMQLYKREVIQSLFYELLAEAVEAKLKQYGPVPSIYPMPDRYDLEVDFEMRVTPRPVYLFGAKDVAKTRLVAICCLEFQKAKLPFISFVVHEDFESLSRKDQARITSAADKQFVNLDDFRENAEQVMEREVAV